jgi:hypothetical protein
VLPPEPGGAVDRRAVRYYDDSFVLDCITCMAYPLSSSFNLEKSTMKTVCMDCQKVTRNGEDDGIVSHGVCEPCFIVRTAHFRPHTMLEWISEARTTADQILTALSCRDEREPDRAIQPSSPRLLLTPALSCGAVPIYPGQTAERFISGKSSCDALNALSDQCRGSFA